MIEIVDYEPKFATAFYELNQVWILKFFEMEPNDFKTLENPKNYILDKGGFIFVALLDKIPVGVCALLKVSDSIYELSKMAVYEKFQGKNLGNKMLEYCVDKARQMKLEKLILYSNTLLNPAIHLYKKYGFTEVIGFESEYKRANIKMEIVLK